MAAGGLSFSIAHATLRAKFFRNLIPLLPRPCARKLAKEEKRGVAGPYGDELVPEKAESVQGVQVVIDYILAADRRVVDEAAVLRGESEGLGDGQRLGPFNDQVLDADVRGRELGHIGDRRGPERAAEGLLEPEFTGRTIKGFRGGQQMPVAQ